MTTPPADPPDGPDDELTRMLRRLGNVSPDATSSVDDVMGAVRHRVVRRQQASRTAVAVLAAAAAVALVAIPGRLAGGPDTNPSNLTANPTLSGFPTGSPGPTGHPSASASPHRGESPGRGNSPGSGPGTNRPGGNNSGAGDKIKIGPGPGEISALGCPMSWGGTPDSAWVPAGPTALGDGALLQAGAEQLVVCGYPASTSGARVLSGDASVHGGFADMASALASDSAAKLAWCPDAEGAEDFLVRAVYPGGDVTWVAATAGDECGGATNGAFTGSGSFAGQLAGVLAQQGTWGGSYPGDCAVTDARPGRGESMVPSGATQAFICVSDPAAGQKAQTQVQASAVDRLTGQLKQANASSGSPNCDASGPTYLVNFRYPGGENVSVRVVPDCDQGVFNGELVATPSDNLVQELQSLTGG